MNFELVYIYKPVYNMNLWVNASINEDMRCLLNKIKMFYLNWFNKQRNEACQVFQTDFLTTVS